MIFRLALLQALLLICEQNISGTFISACLHTVSVARCIREVGGLCIADEIGVGLGRVGEHYWAFQAQGEWLFSKHQMLSHWSVLV